MAPLARHAAEVLLVDDKSTFDDVSLDGDAQVGWKRLEQRRVVFTIRAWPRGASLGATDGQHGAASAGRQPAAA
jgi:hypothetical protein